MSYTTYNREIELNKVFMRKKYRGKYFPIPSMKKDLLLEEFKIVKLKYNFSNKIIIKNYFYMIKNVYFIIRIHILKRNTMKR